MGNIEKRAQTACFTGHRNLNEADDAIESRVLSVMEDLIQHGYRYFGAGGARGFDALASVAVLKMKQKYPQIHLILVLPFDEQYRKEGNWTRDEIKQYDSLKKAASKVVILAPGYSSGIYYQRNRHLVDSSSVCIAYLNRTNSGTGYTVNYARKNGLRVVNVSEPV